MAKELSILELMELAGQMDRLADAMPPALHERFGQLIMQAVVTGDDRRLKHLIKQTNFELHLRVLATQDAMYAATVPFDLPKEPDRGPLLLGHTVLGDPVSLTLEELTMHIDINGRTGSGKTSLVMNLIAQIMDMDGRGET